jgi:heptosyltransferase-2
MHLAEAAGVPVLAFFGPTVRGFGFAPWRRESRVLEREMPCRPCSLHGRKPCRKGGLCLNDISPEEAWLALEGMLDG